LPVARVPTTLVSHTVLLDSHRHVGDIIKASRGRSLCKVARRKCSFAENGDSGSNLPFWRRNLRLRRPHRIQLNHGKWKGPEMLACSLNHQPRNRSRPSLDAGF
jgi:hypothetical protein